jgi:hypothetical protein
MRKKYGLLWRLEFALMSKEERTQQLNKDRAEARKSFAPLYELKPLDAALRALEPGGDKRGLVSFVNKHPEENRKKISGAVQAIKDIVNMVGDAAGIYSLPDIAAIAVQKLLGQDASDIDRNRVALELLRVVRAADLPMKISSRRLAIFAAHAAWNILHPEKPLMMGDAGEDYVTTPGTFSDHYPIINSYSVK